MQANLVNIPEVATMLMYKLGNGDNMHNWNVGFWWETCIFFLFPYCFLGRATAKIKYPLGWLVTLQSFVRDISTPEHDFIYHFVLIPVFVCFFDLLGPSQQWLQLTSGSTLRDYSWLRDHLWTRDQIQFATCKTSVFLLFSGSSL